MQGPLRGGCEDADHADRTERIEFRGDEPDPEEELGHGLRAGFFYVILGAIFAITGYGQDGLDFSFYMGAAFLAYGVWTFFRTYRYARIVAGLPEETDSPP
jgi:hypothetical protein